MRLDNGLEIDENLDAAAGICLIKGCGRKRNPGECCLCAVHHPRCDIVAEAQRAANESSGSTPTKD